MAIPELGKLFAIKGLDGYKKPNFLNKQIHPAVMNCRYAFLFATGYLLLLYTIRLSLFTLK